MIEIAIRLNMNNEDLKALRVMIAAQKRVIGDIYVLSSEMKLKMHNLCDNHVDLLAHFRLYEHHQYALDKLLDKMGELRSLADISLVDDMIKEGWEPVPWEDR